jgi:ABC-type nitrate/sulfonate/bicarbonate transport system substrate-binding protein
MPASMGRRSTWCAALAVALMLTGGVESRAQTLPKLTIGYGPASDVTLTLLKLKPDIAVHFGKSYTLDLQEFRGNDMRFRAYLSRALDGATASSNAIADAAAKGVDLTIVASISKESSQGFSTSYMVKDDSPIKSTADLKGRLIGINAYHSSIETWARLAVRGAGLDPDRDVRFSVVEFPVQGQALRSGQVDVGAFPLPFARIEQAKGGLRVLFTARDTAPFDQETQMLFFRRSVLQASPQAVKDFLADLAAETRFYIDQPDEARKLLLKADIIRMPEDIYLGMTDYYRSPDLRVDVEAMQHMQTLLKSVGAEAPAVDFDKIVDQSFLPK